MWKLKLFSVVFPQQEVKSLCWWFI